jgi:hypothetical protein
LIFRKDRPGDPRDLIGHSDSNNVFMRALFELGYPQAELVMLPVQVPHERPCAVDEQFSNVRVSPFGHAGEHRLAAGRVLPWHQSEPRGEIAATREGRAITHRSHKGRRTERAYPRDGFEASAKIATASEDLKISRTLINGFIERLPVLTHPRHQLSHAIGQSVIRVLEYL